MTMCTGPGGSFSGAAAFTPGICLRFALMPRWYAGARISGTMIGAGAGPNHQRACAGSAAAITRLAASIAHAPPLFMVELKRTSPGPDSAALLFVARQCQNDQAMPLPASYARGAP